MGEAKYMVAWPAGRLDFQKKRAAPHPCGGYIFGISILLDIFSYYGCHFPYYGRMGDIDLPALCLKPLASTFCRFALGSTCKFHPY